MKKLKNINNSNRRTLKRIPFERNILKLIFSVRCILNNPIHIHQYRYNSTNKLSSGKPGFFSSLFNRFVDKTFIFDNRLSWKTFIIFTPSICMMFYHVFLTRARRDDYLAFYNKHFQCNIENLKEGRYYTILTSSIGSAGNIMSGSASEAVSLLLFSGFLIRNSGFMRTLIYFLGGHTIGTVSSLIINQVGCRKFEKYVEWLNSSDQERCPIKINREKRKYCEAEFQNMSEDSYEVAKAEVYNLGEQEFAELAKKRYSERLAFASGGGLALTLLILRMYPKSLIPLPYIGIPTALFFGAQAMLVSKTNTHYSNKELMVIGASLVVWPFVFKEVALRSVRFSKNMPNEMLRRLHLSRWIKKEAKIEQKIDPVILRMEDGHKLSKNQIEMMRRRNEKYKKNKGKE